MSLATVRFPKGAAAPSAAVLRRVRAAMERDGAVRFDGLFPRPLLERVRASVLRRLRSGELRRRGLVRDIAGRYAAVVPFEGPLLDPAFYGSPRLHAMLGGLLGAHYCIGSLEAVVAEPGAVGQHQHIDGPIRLDRTVGGRKRAYPRDLSDLPPYAVTLSIPLCDIDEENGPTAIWPGSHRAALSARPPSEAAVARRWPVERMTGPFGQSFFFDYRVYHGGTPNWSREARAVLMFVFTRTWYRDPNLNEVHPRLVVSPRGLARVPERLRPLFMLAPAALRPLWTGRRA
ncbi:MAG: phytanoyl-CoA dioxygenase family protein [Elusimicrobia bacterium]|nr:phytanoyl-CoA dioxygenase family protein [Elusimicrobiota bacterium]